MPTLLANNYLGYGPNSLWWYTPLGSTTMQAILNNSFSYKVSGPAYAVLFRAPESGVISKYYLWILYRWCNFRSCLMGRKISFNKSNI